jgi:electron transport complex protein RnfG
MHKDEFKSIAEIEKNEKRKAQKDNSDTVEILKNFIVILVISVVAGGVLGFVHEITKEPIRQMEELKILRANQRVFAGAASFNESTVSDEDLNSYITEFENVSLSDCLEAVDQDGNLLGYVFKCTSNAGYGGNISFSMGIALDGTLNGISITEISETPGLGMRAEEVLVPQFKNKNVSLFELTKSGAMMDYQIDAISSATITSKAVTEAVNAGLLAGRTIINGGEEHE